MIRRALTWAANDVPVWVWLVVLVLLFCALTACRPPTPPPVYALATPVMPSPSPPKAPATATGDACPTEPVVPGAPLAAAPKGVATCRGLVVDEAQVYDWMGAEDDAAYYRDIAASCYEARADDRALAESVAAARWQGWQDATRDARAARWAGYGLGVGGLLVGVAIGIAAEAVAP